MPESNDNCDHITEKFLADNPQLAKKIAIIEQKYGNFKFSDIRKEGKIDSMPDEERILAGMGIIELGTITLNEKEQASYYKYDSDMHNCQNHAPAAPQTKLPRSR